MKQEYLVTGKMSDGNDYRHKVIAKNKYKAIEQALTDWSHEVDSQFTYPVKMKAAPISNKIAELEAELKVAKEFNWILIVGLIVMTIIAIMAKVGY